MSRKKLCLNCGETNDLEAHRCWNCQADDPSLFKVIADAPGPANKEPQHPQHDTQCWNCPATYPPHQAHCPVCTAPARPVSQHL